MSRVLTIFTFPFIESQIVVWSFFILLTGRMKYVVNFLADAVRLHNSEQNAENNIVPNPADESSVPDPSGEININTAPNSADTSSALNNLEAYLNCKDAMEYDKIYHCEIAAAWASGHFDQQMLVEEKFEEHNVLNFR